MERLIKVYLKGEVNVGVEICDLRQLQPDKYSKNI